METPHRIYFFAPCSIVVDGSDYTYGFHLPCWSFSAI